jgi:hypothetical protein
MKEKVIAAAVAAAVVAAAGGAVEQAHAEGRYVVECFDKDGNLENIRAAERNLEVYAASNSWPNVQVGWTTIDLPRASGDALHFDDTSGQQRRSMMRCIQSALKFLGASANGPSGAPFSGRGPTINQTPVSRVGNVVTLAVVHEGGNAISTPSGGAPSGFLCNTAADFSGTSIACAAAIVSGQIQVTLTSPSYPCYLKYLGGQIGQANSCNPDISNPIYDNVTYPSGTSSPDTEARGLPLLPTYGAITVT